VTASAAARGRSPLSPAMCWAIRNAVDSNSADLMNWPRPVLLALAQRRLDANDGEHAADDIDDRRTGAHGWPGGPVI